MKDKDYIISSGLYADLKRWQKNPETDRGLCTLVFGSVYNELRQLLRMEYGASIAPFNNNHYAYYSYECDDKACHLNPDRIAFVNRHVARYEAAHGITT